MRGWQLHVLTTDQARAACPLRSPGQCRVGMCRVGACNVDAYRVDMPLRLGPEATPQPARGPSLELAVPQVHS